MSCYLALLRGVNVSGKNSLRMDELKASLSALGLSEPQSYLQSGNVLFKAGKQAPEKLAAAIQARIAQDFGLTVPVLVLTAAQLAHIVQANPLWSAGDDETLFHCSFLWQAVSGQHFSALKLPAVAGEQAQLQGSAVYLHCPHGYGKTKLNNSYFERALGVPATTRNWRTVLALHALCNGV
jgi:uncharacterized protein (DUF1697 family)